MTREVQIGEQIVKLRATARLPIAYRALHNRDLLRDMDAWREKLKTMLEEQESAESPSDTAEASVDTADSPVDVQEVPADEPEASEETDEETLTETADASEDNLKIMRELDLDFMARLAYTMAKSAEPSIPNDVGEWLDTIDDPNGLYVLAGESLRLYGSGFETTAEAKKIPRHDAANNDRAVYAPHSAIRLIHGEP